MKRCFVCLVTKPLSGFYIHKQMRDGHLNKCIECTKRYERERRIANREQLIAYDRMRYRRDRDKVLARNLRWVREHQEKIAAYKRQWAEEHQELVREYGRKYRLRNAETVRANQKKFYQRHLDRLRPLYREAQLRSSYPNASPEIVAVFGQVVRLQREISKKLGRVK